MPSSTREPTNSTRIIAQIVYGLHALTIVMGICSAASVIGLFLFSWPSILAVVLNYVFRGDALHTYLESHFAWQIRTFWYAALWTVLIGFLGWTLVWVGVGFFLWFVGYPVLGIWVAWRIFSGWLRLQDKRDMPL